MEPSYHYHEILRGMARALFVCAWVDWAESDEGPGYPPGCELTEVAPETSLDAILTAAGLACSIARANKWHSSENVSILFGKACEVDGIPDNAQEPYAYEFGWYLAMQALGHGVSWFDDHEKFPLEFPTHTEADWYEMEETPGLLEQLKRNGR